MDKEIIHYFKRKIIDHKESMSTMVNEFNRANYQREIDNLESYIQHLANGDNTTNSKCNIPLIRQSAFNEAYEKWYNTKDDGELGNWLYAKSKGIIP